MPKPENSDSDVVLEGLGCKRSEPHDADGVCTVGKPSKESLLTQSTTTVMADLKALSNSTYAYIYWRFKGLTALQSCTNELAVRPLAHWFIHVTAA